MKAKAPAADEIEVSLFGSGFGEAVAVHLPGGKWVLIDSCVAPRDPNKLPVSGAYLDLLGIDPANVGTIVASHWHADHTRGLSKLASRFINAEIHYPNFMRQTEGLEFLATFSGKGLSPASGTGELYQLFKDFPTRMIPVGMKSELLESYQFNGTQISGIVLSPMPAAFAGALAWVQKQLGSVGGQVRHATMPSPNFSSIAVSLSMGNESILLGSDLEEHKAYGWTALAEMSRWKNGPKASLYKVAHHGSDTGHSDAKWMNLLAQNPVSVLTPFAHGRVSLPTQQDVLRIKSQSISLHTASGASLSSTLSPTQTKLLRQIATRVTSVHRKLGQVRYRKKLGNAIWDIEVFDAALKL